MQDKMLVMTLLLASGIALFGIQAAGQTTAGWKAGVARCDITPKTPMWLAGYGSRDRVSEGTIHPIWAKAMVLQDATGHRAVLVTTDVLGFPKEMSDSIRDRLKKEFGFERADIILSSSHTHSGPVLRDSLYSIYPLDEAQIKTIEQYSDWLADEIVKLVGEAIAALKPAQVSSANGIVRFAVNRRTNREGELVETSSLNGPVDHAVPVLRVAGEDGGLMAVAFGYACHSTVLCEYQWCGDYPGFAQVALEEAHPGATAMFFAGCSADQNPLPRRTVPLARQYGRELAAAVDRVLEDPMTALEPKLGTYYAEAELALTPPPTREQLQQTVEKGSIYEQRAAREFLKRLDAGQPLKTSHPCPVQLWQVGTQAIVTIGGEVVIDYAHAIKGMLGRQTFVMGYANDLFAYLPSLRVLKEGGYEGGGAQVYYGQPGIWQDDVEIRVLTAIHGLAVQAGLSPAEPDKVASKPANVTPQ